MKFFGAVFLATVVTGGTLTGCIKPPPPQPAINPFTAAFLANLQARANGQPFVPPPVSKTAIAGAPTRIAFLQNLNPDCSVRDIPTLRVLTQPAHGKAVNKQMEDFGSFGGPLSNFACNKTKARGVALDYSADAAYTGPDTLVYEVIYSNGTDQTTTVNLTVK